MAASNLDITPYLDVKSNISHIDQLSNTARDYSVYQEWIIILRAKLAKVEAMAGLPFEQDLPDITETRPLDTETIANILITIAKEGDIAKLEEAYSQARMKIQQHIGLNWWIPIIRIHSKLVQALGTDPLNRPGEKLTSENLNAQCYLSRYEKGNEEYLKGLDITNDRYREYIIDAEDTIRKARIISGEAIYPPVYRSRYHSIGYPTFILDAEDYVQTGGRRQFHVDIAAVEVELKKLGEHKQKKFWPRVLDILLAKRDYKNARRIATTYSIPAAEAKIAHMIWLDEEEMKRKADEEAQARYIASLPRPAEYQPSTDNLPIAAEIGDDTPRFQPVEIPSLLWEPSTEEKELAELEAQKLIRESLRDNQESE